MVYFIVYINSLLKVAEYDIEDASITIHKGSSLLEVFSFLDIALQEELTRMICISLLYGKEYHINCNSLLELDISKSRDTIKIVCKRKNLSYILAQYENSIRRYEYSVHQNDIINQEKLANQLKNLSFLIDTYKYMYTPLNGITTTNLNDTLTLIKNIFTVPIDITDTTFSFPITGSKGYLSLIFKFINSITSINSITIEIKEHSVSILFSP